MPQEFHVVKCFRCEMFQVQIVKKVNKHQCKMCGEKQSVKKEYGRGTGKDCRIHVQKLNELHIQSNSKLNNIEISENIETENQINYNNSQDTNTKSSKWSEYLPEEENNSEIEVENNSEFENFTFERPNKRKKHSNMNKIRNNMKTKTETSGTSTYTSKSVEKSCYNLENSSEDKNLIKHNENQLKINISNKKSKWNNFIVEDQPPKIINEPSLLSTERETVLRKNIFNTDDDNLDDVLNF